MKRYLLGMLLLGFASILTANQEDERFQLANEAYQANDYKKAIKLYKQVYDQGYRSPELEYNLANAYYRQQDLGRAILHYERALILAPEDRDAQQNLNLARQKVNNNFEVLPEFFLTTWWKSLRRFASSSIWSLLALVLWWMGITGLCFWLLGKTRVQKKTGFVTGITLILLSILPFALAFSRMKYEQNTNQAIILTDNTALRSAPDHTGTSVLELHAGTKVKLLETLGGWWQIQAPNGEKGWLNNEELEEI